jgi:hypothetical protein
MVLSETGIVVDVAGRASFAVRYERNHRRKTRVCSLVRVPDFRAHHNRRRRYFASSGSVAALLAQSSHAHHLNLVFTNRPRGDSFSDLS